MLYAAGRCGGCLKANGMSIGAAWWRREGEVTGGRRRDTRERNDMSLPMESLNAVTRISAWPQLHLTAAGIRRAAWRRAHRYARRRRRYCHRISSGAMPDLS